MGGANYPREPCPSSEFPSKILLRAVNKSLDIRKVSLPVIYILGQIQILVPPQLLGVMAVTSGIPRPLLHVPYIYVMVFTFILPTLSLFTIATLGVYLHFEETTGTHCKVSAACMCTGLASCLVRALELTSQQGGAKGYRKEGSRFNKYSVGEGERGSIERLRLYSAKGQLCQLLSEQWRHHRLATC